MNNMLSKADIILIEDNPADADLCLRALKKNGHTQVSHFEDGAEALQAIFQTYTPEINSRHLPQLIILDLKLPGLHGKEVLKQLKENDLSRMIPVLVLTSSNQHKDVIDCYRLGANAYVVKPLDFDAYMLTVSQAANFWMQINYMPHEIS